MKKSLFLCGLLAVAVLSQAQTVTADRVIARQGLYVKDTWIDSIQRDTGFTNQSRAIPTSSAVKKYVDARTGVVKSSDTLYAKKLMLNDSTLLDADGYPLYVKGDAKIVGGLRSTGRTILGAGAIDDGVNSLQVKGTGVIDSLVVTKHHINILDNQLGQWTPVGSMNGNTYLGARAFGTERANNRIFGSIQNTMIGYRAGENLIGGQQNFIGGFFSGNSITTGSFNTVIGGRAAAGSLGTGSFNTVIGNNTGLGLGKGVNNTYLGYQIVSFDSAYNTTAIGQGITVAYNNTQYLGNATQTTIIQGRIILGVVNPNPVLFGTDKLYLEGGAKVDTLKSSHTIHSGAVVYKVGTGPVLLDYTNGYYAVKTNDHLILLSEETLPYDMDLQLPTPPQTGRELRIFITGAASPSGYKWHPLSGIVQTFDDTEIDTFDRGLHTLVYDGLVWRIK